MDIAFRIAHRSWAATRNNNKKIQNVDRAGKSSQGERNVDSPCKNGNESSLCGAGIVETVSMIPDRAEGRWANLGSHNCEEKQEDKIFTPKSSWFKVRLDKEVVDFKYINYDWYILHRKSIHVLSCLCVSVKWHKPIEWRAQCPTVPTIQ